MIAHVTSKKDGFVDALDALYALLAHAKQAHWRDWIALDIDQWEHNRSVAHHLKAYTGVGSLADYIYPAPGKDEQHTALMSALFNELREVCLQLATAANSGQLPLKLTFAPLDLQLAGALCPQCGYAEVQPQAVGKVLMHYLARQWVIIGWRTHTLQALARRAIQNQRPDLQTHEAHLLAQVAQRGLTVRKRQRPMQNCLNCGTKTQMHSWTVALPETLNEELV